MLYSIGQAAVRRVVAGAPQLSRTRSLLSIWPRHVEIASKPCLFPARTYASTTQAQNSTKATRSSTRVTETKPKPKTRSTKTKSTKGKKKPARKVAKKKPAKKTKAKKPKAKKSTRKTLTEQQKTAAVLKKQRSHLKTLRATSLSGSEPKQGGRTAWQVYFIERVTGTKNPTGHVKQVAAQYKSLEPAELEQLNHKANENIATNNLAYKRWVESHTPEQIRKANSARSTLRKQYKKEGKNFTGSLRRIQDARLPLGVRTGFSMFTKERWASGDLRGIALSDAARLLSKEWKAQTSAERKTYQDRSAADGLRYRQEYETVYKHPLPSRARKAKSA